MTRLLSIVRREFVERVRTKGFVIGTVLGPLVLVAMMLVPSLAASRTGKPLRIAVLDLSEELAGPVEKALAGITLGQTARFVVVPSEAASVEERRGRLRAEVLDGRLDGFVLLPEAALGSSVAEYYGKNVSNLADLHMLETAVEQALIGERLSRAGLPPERAKEATRSVEMKVIRVSAGGERVDRGASFLFSVVLLMMIYAAVIMWGQALLTSVIEEKNNRVVEVVASSVDPSRLLAGKLLGVGAAGLVQFLVWAAAMAAAGLYAGGSRSSELSLPEVTPLLLGSFVVFFLLGFFLYGALYAAIGASVNSVQEAQSLVFPALAPVVSAVVLFPVILRAPDSTLSVTLSLIPLFTPLLMFLRVTVLPPPPWQLGLSIALTTLTIWAVVWVSARVYRVGILMYGKRPTFPEIMRWVAHRS